MKNKKKYTVKVYRTNRKGQLVVKAINLEKQDFTYDCDLKIVIDAINMQVAEVSGDSYQDTLEDLLNGGGGEYLDIDAGLSLYGEGLGHLTLGSILRGAYR